MIESTEHFVSMFYPVIFHTHTHTPPPTPTTTNKRRGFQALRLFLPSVTQERPYSWLHNPRPPNSHQPHAVFVGGGTGVWHPLWYKPNSLPLDWRQRWWTVLRGGQWLERAKWKWVYNAAGPDWTCLLQQHGLARTEGARGAVLIHVHALPAPTLLGHRVNDTSRAARAELAGLDPCCSPEAEVSDKWWQIVVLFFAFFFFLFFFF